MMFLKLLRAAVSIVFIPLVILLDIIEQIQGVTCVFGLPFVFFNKLNLINVSPKFSNVRSIIVTPYLT
uniref:Uncharacterized protein n=1 Tax=Anopheles darlingi TaxID=43151 RepID=A0A2M4DJN9_ANODA